MALIIPKLGLNNILDNALDGYAQDKVDKLKNNAAFQGVKPDVKEVDSKNAEYRAALAKADEGTKADTAAKNKRREELEDLLTLQAQDCAKIANGDLALFLSSGYEAKKKATPIGNLPQVMGMELAFGDNEGELKARWDAVSGTSSYAIEISPDPFNEKSWLRIKPVTKSRATVAIKEEGIASGQRCWVRVAAIGAAGQGPWSDPAVKMVP